MKGILNLDKPANVPPAIPAKTGKQAADGRSILLYKFSNDMNPDTFDVVWKLGGVNYCMSRGEWIPVAWSADLGSWVPMPKGNASSAPTLAMH